MPRRHQRQKLRRLHLLRRAIKTARRRRPTHQHKQAQSTTLPVFRAKPSKTNAGNGRTWSDGCRSWSGALPSLNKRKPKQQRSSNSNSHYRLGFPTFPT